MIDHVGITVTDIAAARAFYEAALKPLGYAVQMEIGPDKTESKGTSIGFGTPEFPFFWIGDGKPPGTNTHIAFKARDAAAVDAFHAAAIAAGGRDNGAPGPRPHYHPGYYGAFVHDLDGNNIEAVFHGANG